MPRIPTTVVSLSAMMLVVALGGCSAYDTRYAFEPRPVEVDLTAPDGSGATVAQAIASVVGVRRAVPEDGFDSSVEVRLRIESVSDRPMQFDPRSLSLLSADLQKFPPPHIEPSGVVEVRRGSPADVVAWFPFPIDSSRPPMDLSGLNVRWSVSLDDQTVPGSITVRRRRYSAPPHWLYGWNFGYSYHGHGHRGHGYRGHGRRGYGRSHFGFGIHF